MRFSERTLRALSITFFLTSVALGIALAGSWRFFYSLTLDPGPTPATITDPRHAAAPVSPLLLSYQLDVPGRGEIFPALSAGAGSDYWPVAVLSVSNNSDRPVVQTISAEVVEWSRRSEQTFVIGARETRKIDLNPELLPAAFQNSEIRRATLRVRASTPERAEPWVQTRPVFLHSSYDLYWGKKFANAQYLARWVTPHSQSVLRLVAAAKQNAPRGRLPGYDATARTPKAMAASVRMQAAAVVRALQRSGITYVNSVFTFGNYIGQAQRIRLPEETLRLSSANCVDVSVAFAAAMENIGLRPVIVIVPGHAFAGVRLGRESNEILYVDLTVLPKGGFDAAVARANYWLKKTKREQVLTVDIAAARVLGIYPMPEFPQVREEPKMASERELERPGRSR